MYFLCCSMYFCVVLCIVWFVSLCVLFVCMCVLYDCHRVATQLQLNIYHIISYHIISYHITSHHIIYHILVWNAIQHKGKQLPAVAQNSLGNPYVSCTFRVSTTSTFTTLPIYIHFEYRPEHCLPSPIFLAIFLSPSKQTPGQPNDIFNPYPANVGKYGELLNMQANGRWDLIRRLKG